MTTAQAEDSIAILERFVVENDDLLALEALINRFNIFDALGIKNVEIRHSNFLAFILDPAESHGQGQLFLKALLTDLLKTARPGQRPLSPVDLDGIDLRGVEVRREWKHLDLLIICQQPRFLVVIENKIRSIEGRDQLVRYERVMKTQFPGDRPLFVYLTLDADEPSDGAWMPYSHADIHRVFRRVRETYAHTIGDDVLVFLDHYLNLIGTRFMTDSPESQRIDELCQRIYKTHRQALDLIWARVGTPASGVLAAVQEVLAEDSRWHVFARSSRVVDVVPSSWLEWLPPLALKSEDPRDWIHARLAVREDKLDWAVQLAPMKDEAKRKDIQAKLFEVVQQCGITLSKSRGVKNNLTRVSAVESVFEWGEADPESEEMLATIRDVVKQKLDALYPKLEELADVLKPLCGVP